MPVGRNLCPFQEPQVAPEDMCACLFQRDSNICDTGLSEVHKLLTIVKKRAYPYAVRDKNDFFVRTA